MSQRQGMGKGIFNLLVQMWLRGRQLGTRGGVYQCKKPLKQSDACGAEEGHVVCDACS